jgi:hypothetical protein
LTALILPVPVAIGDRSHSVRFIDLASYRDFFKDLDRVFQRDCRNSRAPKRVQVLESVTPLDLTYLPTVESFSTVDNRLRLNGTFWGQLPQYSDCGFVLVTLPDTLDTIKTVCPFAFEFQTRLVDSLIFFPTLQLNQFRIDAQVFYDHELFYQGAHRSVLDYTSSSQLDVSIDYTRARSLLAKTAAFKRHLAGKYPNGDVII